MRCIAAGDAPCRSDNGLASNSGKFYAPLAGRGSHFHVGSHRATQRVQWFRPNMEVLSHESEKKKSKLAPDSAPRIYATHEQQYLRQQALGL